MMATRAYFRSFVEACVFLTLLVAVRAAPQDGKSWSPLEEVISNETKCPGPLGYYENLDCTPVYKNLVDFCPDRYNCSHLKEMSRDKCYVKDYAYSRGEFLKPEHSECFLSCVCTKSSHDFSEFRCENCPSLPDIPNCYYRNSHDQCCPELQVCLEQGEERPICEVEGLVYEDGEFFSPESTLGKICVCMPGYKGENVEPFCRNITESTCDERFLHPENVYRNCAPIFYMNEDPQRQCHSVVRCQNANDTVIHKHDNTKSPLKTDEDDMCRFGNLTMHRGDELNQPTNLHFRCLKCVCEVPPLPTCQVMPIEKCDH